jgi:hypothetical protein
MGAKFKLADLPPHVLARIRAEDRAALGLRCPVIEFSGSGAGQDRGGNEDAKKGRRRPNKTEARYAAEMLRGLDVRYEAVTVRLANGHRYTPDWVVFEGGRPVACHEVKGAYRFGSHQRARLAFDQAAAEWPGVRWVWATWTGDEWKIDLTHKTGSDTVRT